MRTVFILTFFFSFNNVLATSFSNFDVCQRQGEDFGKLSDISKECRYYALKNTSKLNQVSSETVNVFGHKNILFIDMKVSGKTKHFTVAGSKTLLKNIQMVKLSSNRDKVYVLEEGSLLVFDVLTSGNSAPVQVFNVGGKNCKNLQFAESEKVAYLHCGNSIARLGLVGDSRLTKVTKKAKPATKWDLFSFKMSSDVEFNIYNDQFVILDRSSSKVSAFSLEQYQLRPKLEWSINLSEVGMVRKPAAIEVDGNKMTIIDVDGKAFEFD